VVKLANGRFLLSYETAEYATGGAGLYYQMLDESGAAITGSRLVARDYYDRASFIAQEDGGYVVVKAQEEGADTLLSFQRFDADGAATGSETAGISLGGSEIASFEVTALEDGGWVVSWWGQEQTELGTAATLHLQAYDQEGNAFGVPATMGPFYNSGFSPLFFEHAVTALDGGGFAFTFGMSSGYELRYAGNWIYSAEGNPISWTPDLVDLMTEASEGALNFTTAARPDGGMIFVRRVAGDIVVEQFDGAGQRDHDAVTIDTDLPNGAYAGPASFLKVTALAGGGFVVSWEGVQTSNGFVVSTGLFVQSFDADGNVIDHVVTVDGNGPAYIGEYDIIALSDGGFAIAWDYRTGPDDVDVLAQVFGATGEAKTESFLLQTQTGLDQIRPDLTALADGSFLAFWTDGANSSNAIIRGQTFGNPDQLIKGTAGADVMAGGIGNDRYIVNHAGDVVIEKAGEGFDTVDTSISYTLTENVESLRLIGIKGAVDAHGNAGNNWLNAAWVDVAPEAGTMIRLYGEGGDDNLLGSRYGDRLDGGTGADTMTGGGGNDRYVVDNVGDMVIEKAGEGFDTVDTSISYTLTANVESLRLIGITGAVDAHGNDGNNWLNAVWVDVAPAAGTMIRLFGEGGNDNLLGSRYSDLLDGGAGADRMTGGFGNDRYVVDNVGDMVIEKAGEGFDTVDTSISYTLTANVESLRLIGITGAVDAHGNAGNNWLNAAWVDVAPAAGTMIRLFGEGGNDNLLGSRYGDLLDGGAGSDMLTGGAGNDRFHFGDVLDAATNVDTILDFQKGDVIELDDAIFSALSAGALDAGQFVANADGVATSADNRIIYDTDSGQLFYDADGSLGGAAILFGVVAGHPPLTGADFVVV